MDTRTLFSESGCAIRNSVSRIDSNVMLSMSMSEKALLLLPLERTHCLICRATLVHTDLALRFVPTASPPPSSSFLPLRVKAFSMAQLKS